MTEITPAQRLRRWLYRTKGTRAGIDTLEDRFEDEGITLQRDDIEAVVTDAEDLGREVANLREYIATGAAPASEAIMQLREWLRPWPTDLDIGAVHIAMPGPMARTILAELDKVTRQRDELLEQVGKLARS